MERCSLDMVSRTSLDTLLELLSFLESHGFFFVLVKAVQVATLEGVQVSATFEALYLVTHALNCAHFLNLPLHDYCPR